jgi:hypothetical protein
MDAHGDHVNTSPMPSGRHIACLAAALAIGGCGGGGSHGASFSNPALPASTKAAFVAKADALCAAGKSTEPDEAQIATLLTTVPFPRAHITAVLTSASQAIHHYASLIGALPRPAADTAEIATWLSQADHLASLLGTLGSEAAANNSGGMNDAMDKTLTSIIEDVGPPENFAATYGLNSCSSF